MREARNATLVVLLFVAFGWAFWTWLGRGPGAEHLWLWRCTSLLVFACLAGSLVWALRFEDKLPDTLARYTGGIYYEKGGLALMPIMRKEGQQALLYLYYENRYGNACNAVVHLRPPKGAILHRPDAVDIHFAFSCPGGAVGVLQQPVAVHPRLQGQVIDVALAAAVNYPHNRGDKLRSHEGLPCGDINVDWGINFRTGAHELSDEIELRDPATVHLAIPRDVTNRIKAGLHWRQKALSPT